MTETVSPLRPLRLTAAEVLADYRLGWLSRHASLLGRREVLTGKAKFGIFGDGKEVAQLAMARAFRAGRLPLRLLPRPDVHDGARPARRSSSSSPSSTPTPTSTREPHSAGRSMNAHFATRLLDADGALARPDRRAAHLGRRLAHRLRRCRGWSASRYASQLYRELPGLAGLDRASRKHGDEIAWGTIGNASCAEGHVLGGGERHRRARRADAALDLGRRLRHLGAERVPDHQGRPLRAARRLPPRAGHGRRATTSTRVRGWDYPALVRDLPRAPPSRLRREHVPAIVHVIEVTQPQGHSTSGSHERYKSRGAAGLGGGVRPAAPDARPGCSTQGLADRRRARRDREPRQPQRRARRAAARLGRLPGADPTPSTDALVELARASSPPAESTPSCAPSSSGRSRRARAQCRRRCAATSRRRAHELLVATRGRATRPTRARARRLDGRERGANRERYGSHLYSEGERSALAVAAGRRRLRATTRRR